MDNPPEATSGKIDLVTVIYEPEIMLLKLQARSIRQFFHEGSLGAIYLVVNELAPEPTYAALVRHVLPEYGDLIRNVEILPMSRLMRPHVNVNGWRTQQSLKLLISRYVSTDHYLVLDAKNHFVRPVDLRQFVDPASGKARTFRIAKHGSLGGYLDNAMAYFDAGDVAESTPATTPYTMITRIVREMVAHIEAREGVPFDDFMHKPGQNLTEFFLYFAYIHKFCGGAEALYRYGPRNSVSLFTRYPNTPEQVEQLLNKAEEGRVVCFGLHKNRVLQLDERFRDRILDFWVGRGLFDDVEEAGIYFALLAESIGGRTTAKVMEDEMQA